MSSWFQISVPRCIAGRIISQARHVVWQDMVEEDPHITLFYGVKIPDEKQVLSFLGSNFTPNVGLPPDIELGKISFFGEPGDYAMVANAEPHIELHQLHEWLECRTELIQAKDETVHHFAIYRPHVTLGRVNTKSVPLDHLRGFPPIPFHGITFMPERELRKKIGIFHFSFLYPARGWQHDPTGIYL